MSSALARSTEVDWIPQCPPGWAIKRLKGVASHVDDRLGALPVDGRFLRLENIESWTGRLVDGPSDVEVDGTVTQFQPSDILFGKLRPYLAKAHLAGFAGQASTELLVIRPNRDIIPKYLFHQLLCPSFISEINSWTYGTKMPRVSPDRFMTTRVLVPPWELQRLIVAFLDEKTAQIDKVLTLRGTNIDQISGGAIAKLVKALLEYRSALITAAVTGQIDVSEAA